MHKIETVNIQLCLLEHVCVYVYTDKEDYEALQKTSRKLFKTLCLHPFGFVKPGFRMVVKIESRSSSAEIQHFRTENTRSDYN